MPLPDFHRSAPFTLGIELELQVVNPPGYDLSQDSSRLIDDVKSGLSVGEAKHDITESMLEIATGICRDIHQAATQLGTIQQAVLRAAARHHLHIWRSRPRYSASTSMLAARTAMMRFIFYMACRASFRIVLR